MFTASKQPQQPRQLSNILCRHVFGEISHEFRGISRVLVNFAGFRGFSWNSRLRDRTKYQINELRMNSYCPFLFSILCSWYNFMLSFQDASALSITGLAQVFTTWHNKAISWMKLLLHVETFLWNWRAMALWNKFQQALHSVIWSVWWNFFELPLWGKYHVK